MQQDIQTHTYENGLTLVVQTMNSVQSAAFSLIVPSGSIYDPDDQHGSAVVLSDWMTRGAGEYDSRSLSSALDCLGLQRSESAGRAHLGFSGATLSNNLPEALKIYSQIVLQPHLPDEQFDAVRAGVMQSIQSIQDEPRHLVMLELRRRCYDAPWGNITEGTIESVMQLTTDSVRAHYQNYFRPNESIIGVAGNVDFQEIRDLVGQIFGEWNSIEPVEVKTTPPLSSPGYLQQDSTQTHIGLSYSAVPYNSPDYYAAWAAVSILSGGMSSRLFTEVREKRGLCYAISASMSGLKDVGRVLCYAGTTSERAQETLDVTLRELVKLKDGIDEEELSRCKARAKSALIMQQESSISRAGSLTRDWFHLGRVKTLEEIREKIESLTVAGVLDYVHQHPAENFVLMTIGSEQLEVPSEIS